MKPDRVSLQPVDDLASLNVYKQAYLDSLSAPMDGMWDYGLVPQALHQEILLDGQSIGFVAVNEEHVVMQCFFLPEVMPDGTGILRTLRTENVFDAAFAATIDVAFYDMCRDLGGSNEKHTLLYGLKSAIPPATSQHIFRSITAPEAERTFDFQRAALSLPEAAWPWLRGYTADLIQKQQLRVLTDADNTWIGTGEFRVSPTQPGVVDLGVIVSPDRRRKGYATDILKRLVDEAMGCNMTPICSTTVDNPSSQKAIERAGFVSTHHIDLVRFD